MAKGVCSLGKPTVPCSEYVAQAPTGVGQDVYQVTAANLDTGGYPGLSCGVDYDASFWSGVEMLTWTLCADGLEFRNAGLNGESPAAGGGNIMTRETCQSQDIPPGGVHAGFGSFCVYALDFGTVAPGAYAERQFVITQEAPPGEATSWFPSRSPVPSSTSSTVGEASSWFREPPTR